MTLLEEIRGISQEAVHQLEEVGFCTDQDIRLLTQNDWQELLPGLSTLRLRKKIYETIHKKRPIHSVLKELKSFIPDEFLIDAFSSNGALQDYLQILKALKSEVDHVQEFLDAHIDLLEKFGQREDTNPNNNQALVSSVDDVTTAPPNANYKDLFYNFQSKKVQDSPFTPPQIQAAVRYKMRVSGNTLNRHMDVLEKLKSNAPDSFRLQEAKGDEDSQLTILFCSVVSRAGTDVKTALHDISDDKPVIVVMMHHSRCGFAASVGQVPHHNVVLLVNVFFHETVSGLVQCSQNDAAIDKIQTKLRSFSANAKKPFHQSHFP